MHRSKVLKDFLQTFLSHRLIILFQLHLNTEFFRFDIEVILFCLVNLKEKVAFPANVKEEEKEEDGCRHQDDNICVNIGN
jgi:hypothetical protein